MTGSWPGERGLKKSSLRLSLGHFFPYYYQCCGSGMFIPDPDFYPSRIPDPKSATKERGKKICCHTFLCSHKFHKIEYYFSFELLKKIIWAIFQRIIALFTQKIVTKLSKIWVWDPRSGIRKKPIPHPGSRGQKGTGSRIQIRNTDYYSILYYLRWALRIWIRVQVLRDPGSVSRTKGF